MEKAQKNRTLSFSDVQNKLGLSPGMLLEALNEGKIRTNLQRQFQEHENNYQYNRFEYAEIREVCPPKDDFFTEENIIGVTIHEIDLDEALEKYPELDRSKTKSANFIENDKEPHGVPHTNNSVWLSVSDIEWRWGVDRFDIVTRLREGELGSNKFDKNDPASSYLFPGDCYPDDRILEFACHLHKHIWPYEEKNIQLKRYAANKYNEYVEINCGRGLEKYIFKENDCTESVGNDYRGGLDSSFDYIRRTNFEGWMNGYDALQLFNIGPARFIDILNRGIVKTSQEAQRIVHCNDEEKKKNDIWMKDCRAYTPEPFFAIGSLEYILINAYDIADALKTNEELSDIVLSDKAPLSLDCWPPLRGDLPDDFLASNSSGSNSFDSLQHRIGELEGNNTELQARIDELETALAAQPQTDQNDKPRTASATEAAQSSRVEAWKRYAIVMAEIAYDCGLEDRKQVTRSEYMTLAKRHGELSKQALELLRNALPEGVTKKTGGPASQG